MSKKCKEYNRRNKAFVGIINNIALKIDVTKLIDACHEITSLIGQ